MVRYVAAASSRPTGLDESETKAPLEGSLLVERVLRRASLAQDDGGGKVVRYVAASGCPTGRTNLKFRMDQMLRIMRFLATLMGPSVMVFIQDRTMPQP